MCNWNAAQIHYAIQKTDDSIECARNFDKDRLLAEQLISQFDNLILNGSVLKYIALIEDEHQKKYIKFQKGRKNKSMKVPTLTDIQESMTIGT